jgi:DNA-binding NarL/FixJ family response regulator
MTARPRLLLVDDHQLLLEGLRLALQDQYDIVGTCTTGEAVLPACLELKPDAVLLDLSLPDRSGLEIIADLRVESPETKVIIVTMHADRIMADASLQSGAHGFVPKDAGITELQIALEEVLAGRRFVSELVPKHATYAGSADIGFGLSQLTPRQRQIVRMLGEGKRTADIARELNVSPHTVTFHRVAARKALGMDSEWSLVRYAILIRMSEQEERKARS